MNWTWILKLIIKYPWSPSLVVDGVCFQWNKRFATNCSSSYRLMEERFAQQRNVGLITFHQAYSGLTKTRLAIAKCSRSMLVTKNYQLVSDSNPRLWKSNSCLIFSICATCNVYSFLKFSALGSTTGTPFSGNNLDVEKITIMVNIVHVIGLNTYYGTCYSPV